MESSSPPKSPILQIVPLGSQWPTLDPFLFCAHHLDHYPKANGSLGPDSSLDGRTIGQDFANIDGWNMYHGASVPGFPQHPHRGFETVTYLRRGYCDHSDSLGAKARFGEGDMQWLTAGSGIVHAEMFPLFDEHNPNPLHLFQIWLNLPAANKMVDPYFSMYWSRDIPEVVEVDDDGHVTSVTIIAGSTAKQTAPPPPPDSWAAVEEHDVQIWHIKIEPEGVWTLPEGPDTSNRVLYFFEGDELTIAEEPLSPNSGAVLEPSMPVVLTAGSTGTECLLLQGKPIGEPVAQYGPFVMNTESEVQQAMADYRRTQFGGWPWPEFGPTHGNEPVRFVERAD